MNILYLKYVVEIAKTKSISTAAENLYMAQPNLSRAIRELEEDLGITIFKRSSKGITITQDGDEFLQHAKKVLIHFEEIEKIYKDERIRKQRFSVCVPRASYISYAMAEFTKNITPDNPAEIFYKETNSMRTINNVLKEEYNLGIIRYQAAFDKYFKGMFTNKKLVAETISEFSYVLIMSKNSPLVKKEILEPADFTDYIEITHSDPYVPSLPLSDVKKAELSEHVNKYIFVFERASQFLILETNPETFMWVSPIPQNLLDKYNLVQRTHNTDKIYKDVLIYRKGYKLTPLDQQFVTEVGNARRKYL